MNEQLHKGRNIKTTRYMTNVHTHLHKGRQEKWQQDSFFSPIKLAKVLEHDIGRVQGS